MKNISCILLFCFVTLTVTPVSIMVASAIKAQYQTECCMTGDNEMCSMAGMECCPQGMCNPTQCCFCCFICTLDNKKIEIKIFQNNFKNHLSEGQYALSDFASDCWQPPKQV